MKRKRRRRAIPSPAPQPSTLGRFAHPNPRKGDRPFSGVRQGSFVTGSEGGLRLEAAVTGPLWGYNQRGD